MALSPLRISFEFIPGMEYDPFERFRFWDSPSTVEWFRAHGYTLYIRHMDSWGTPSGTNPVVITENMLEDTYPYSYHDTGVWTNDTEKLHAIEYSGKVVFAQDSQHRHVAIKLVRAGSDEEQILRFLSRQSLDTLKEHCLIPVLDFLPAEGFWLVVMPRWGTHIQSTLLAYQDILDIMHSMLKGLTFLHEHNIVHRDIKHGNVLVNHFADDGNCLTGNGARADLRSKRRLSYALFDFDISIMVPSNIDKRAYRLPYELSWWGSGNQPHDTSQGEFDFDPFAYDVGTMGVEFCHCYQQYTRSLPMLAPLLDRMTTRDIQNRFTAAEALQFFEERYAELPQSSLGWIDDNLMDASADGIPYDEYDRWQHVPQDFAAKWASYREPPKPLSTKILRYIVFRDWFPCYVLRGIRWFFFKLESSPRELLAHFAAKIKHRQIAI